MQGAESSRMQSSLTSEELFPLLPSKPQPTCASTTPHSTAFSTLPVPSTRTGYILVFLAAVFQASHATTYRIAETAFGMPPSISLLFYSFSFVTLCLLYLWFFSLFATLKLPRLQLFRLMAHGMCTACTAYLNNIALVYVSVGITLTILATVPALTSVLAMVFLGDPMSLSDVLVLFVNLVGVALVSQPALVSGDHAQLFGIAACLCSVLTASVGFCLVKAMGHRVHFVLNTLAIGLAGLVMCLCITPATDLSQISGDPTGLLLLVFGAVLGFSSQCFINRGVQICRPGPALVVRSCNVPVSLGLGLLFLHEGISPIAFSGVCLVLLSIAFTGFSQVSNDAAGDKDIDVKGFNNSEV